MKLLLLLLILVTTNVFGQKNILINAEPIAFNFEQAMSISQPSEQQIDSILILTEAYASINGDSSLILAKKALELSKETSNKRFHITALIHIGAAHRVLGNYNEGEKIANKALELAKANEEKLLIAYAYDALGGLSKNRGDYESALGHYIKAANIFKDSDKLFDAAVIYSNISGVFFNMNKLEKSRYYDQQSNNIAEDLSNNKLLIDNGANRSINLMTVGINYYLKNELDTANLARHTDTLNFYFKESEDEFYKTLAIARKANAKDMEVVILNNLVALTMNMEKIPKALELATEANLLANKLGDVNLLTQAKFNLSSIYRRLKQPYKAIRYGEESLSMARKYNLDRKIFLANRVLYEVYKDAKQYDKALIVLEELRAYDKKIGDIERSKAIAEVEAQFQNVQKEKEILELKSSNTKITRQRNLIIRSILIMGLFGTGIFQFIRVRRERNDKKDFAEALIFAQENERKRIARDLHDGIGQSLLLLKKQMVVNQNTSVENQAMISQTLEEVRSISQNLHPLQLEKFGLTVAIEDVIQKVGQSTNLFITTEVENIDAVFNQNNNIHIFRVIQEALNNVVKHADATAAKVIVKKNETETFICVMDNGKGFDHELAIAKSKSLGLKTMYERITSIGGKIKIKTNKPSGTMIEFKIPKAS